MAGTDVFVETIALGDLETSLNSPGTALEFHTNRQTTAGSTPASYTVAQAGTIDGVALAISDAGGNVKVCVCDSSGNILATTTETSANIGTQTSPARYYTFPDLDTPINAGASDSYQIWVMVDAGYIRWFQDEANPYAFMCNDTLGSYATPPDPMDQTPTLENRRPGGIQLLGTFSAAAGVGKLINGGLVRS